MSNYIYPPETKNTESQIRIDRTCTANI